MNTLHWLATAVSILWVILFVSKMITSKKEYGSNEH